MAKTAKKQPDMEATNLTVVSAPPPYGIFIDVGWETLPMPVAQQAYATLKDIFEKAGAILNARSMPTDNKYVCYMAGKPMCCPPKIVHDGQPRFIDYSRKNPKTGLMEVVKICSENCSIRYNNLLIEERREKYAPKRGE